jgi:hypothetical protein
MSSGPGTTGKSPLHAEEAIEEISGLLEIEDGLSSAASKKGEEAVDISMDTPAPVTPGPRSSIADGAEPAANMAYEDLLEKLVLPGADNAPAAAEAQDPPFPPVDTPQPMRQTTPAGEDAPWRFPAGPSVLDAAEERTVVTQNPLIAEEQEAAREAAAAQTPTAISDPSYPAVAAATAYSQPASTAETAQVSYAAPSTYNNTPVVLPVAPAPITLQPRSAALAAAPGRVQLSYPMFGGVLLTALIVGGLVVRYLAPAPHVVPVQPEAVVAPAQPVAAPAPVPAQPVAAPAPVPAQPTAAATPSPEVPVPTPPAAPAPEAKAAAPEPTEPAAEAKPAETEPSAEPKAAPKPKAHHSAAKPAPKSAAKPAPVAKPAPAAKPTKPAGKKPGGWADPFAQ